MNILVVEDDFLSRRLLCRYLAPYGDCDVAVDGVEAIQAVRQALDAGGQYDLICLDIMMPGLDGQETLQQIRALEKSRALPRERLARIMMTTALEDDDNVMRAIHSQCDGYVTTPIVKNRFLASLRELGLPVKLSLV